jgi:hypothetical protein
MQHYFLCLSGLCLSFACPKERHQRKRHPTGAPASPVLSLLAMRRAARELALRAPTAPAALAFYVI